MPPTPRRATRCAITLTLATALGLAAAACSDGELVTSREAQPMDADADDSSPDSSSTSSDGTSPGDGAVTGDFEIEWTSSEDGIEEGTLEVPVDYADPEGPTFELYVVRNAADDDGQRIGSLLVNPGGPGFGGSDYAVFASSVYGEELLDRFDIVGWDPRGTGKSTPAIDCVDDYDRFYAEIDITPDDDAERSQLVDLAREYATSCADNNAEILGYIGTNNAARDMEALRIALGGEDISYFGFSYGSELGATWATLFPESVRAAVLDGAADPTADLDEGSMIQLRGFERSLDAFLADCSGNEECPFHNGGDSEAAFDELMVHLDENPIASREERPDVNRIVGIQATITALYSSSRWPQLERALADAQDGDGGGLIDLFDSYYQRRPDGTWGNELEAFQSIVCMDSGERATVAEEDAEAPVFQEIAPRLAPGTTGDYFCTFFPDTDDPRAEVTATGAGPILVVGTTGDPATPLSGSETMAETLEGGVLLVVDAEEHTGYSASPCAKDVVHRYLIDLEPPEDGTECE